jgi:hypothetical protein
MEELTTKNSPIENFIKMKERPNFLVYRSTSS